MSKKSEIKEQISIFKFWLGIVVATFLAIVGWVATNYQRAETWLLIASSVLCIIFVGVAFWIHSKINKKIRKLRDL